MKRIDTADAVDLYLRTGLTPRKGTVGECGDKDACIAAALLCDIGLDRVRDGTSDGATAALVAVGFDSRYVIGLMEGFDGEIWGPVIDSIEQAGIDDGRAVAKALCYADMDPNT